MRICRSMRTKQASQYVSARVLLSRRKDGVVLPLHGGGGEVGLSRFFYSNKRFDTAMTSFLECTKEVSSIFPELPCHKACRAAALKFSCLRIWNPSAIRLPGQVGAGAARAAKCLLIVADSGTSLRN